MQQKCTHLSFYRKQEPCVTGLEVETGVKITFQTSDIPDTGKQYAEKTAKGGNSSHSAGTRSTGAYGADPYQVNFLTDAEKGWPQGGVSGQEKGKSLIELQQEAGNIDVGIQQDYMTVMSNTMSEEDYAKLEEEGFHFADMDPGEAVTIVDKIKAELARSGQEIIGYTDDLDIETLAAAVGSETLARALADSFRQADIPLTEENLDRVQQAWNMASQLHTPTEGASRYMIDNEMEAEIWNFYLAQSSGAQSSNGTVPRYYAEDVQGYYTQSAGLGREEGLQEQVDKIIVQAGFDVNEESRESAAWLMERGLPLTAENLQRLQELQEVKFPVTEESFAEAAANAVAGGKDPVHANLAKSENIYEKAAAMLEYYHSETEWTALEGDITARRQLEEIRLRMTAEVNVKLIKSGFAIDTAPMEQLLEALKRAERQVAEKYFPQDSQAVEKYQTYNGVNQVIEELPGLPAGVLGTYSARETDITLSRFHEEGKELQSAYEKANESYEALMTAPRKDLGDSIRKAFANVDAIVEDLGLEITEENRRAVRILGYNHMDITVENIERIRTADEQVQSIIRKMTPASTLKMIRDGINPLEKSFEELETYFDNQSGEYEETAESYSRFLYGLERRKDISAQEREAYIGIYRMLHQIESSDGAAIGALVNTQAQLQFSNLLSAVRSSRFKSMDVKVEESFGTLSELVRRGESISEQILKGFTDSVKDTLTEVSYSEEAQEAYRAEELAQIREAADADQDVAAFLQKGEVPVNAGNLLAAQALLQDEGKPFRVLKEKAKDRASAPGTGEQAFESVQDSASSEDGEDMWVSEKLEKAFSGTWESLDDKDAFQENYSRMMDELQGFAREASLNQADTSVDVRELKLVHKQLTIAGKLAPAEEYILPMYIGEHLAKVHLTLEHGSMEKGGVHIAVALPDGGNLEAHFALKGGSLSGFLVGNTEEEVTKLTRAADIFSDSVQSGEAGLQDITVDTLPIVSREAYGASSHAGGNHYPVSRQNIRETEGNVSQAESPDNAELYRVAKVFLKAIKEEEVTYEN